MNHVFECGAGESVDGMKDTWYIKRFTWTGHKLNVVVRMGSSDEEYIVAVTPYDIAEMGQREKEAADASS